MIHTLYLQAQDRPAALERLLRVTRHRGFAVTGLNVHPAEDPGQLAISLTVTGERPIHTLSHQMKKLAEVTHLDMKGEEPVQLKMASGE